MAEYAHDHEKAQELHRHRADVDAIRRNAEHWRLVDVPANALEKMRHALIEEMESLEKRMQEVNDEFLIYVEKGRPLRAEQSRESIEQLSNKWTILEKHLQEVDNAILMRDLRLRLIAKLGNERRLNQLDLFIFVAIIAVIILTIIEFILPLTERVQNTFVIIDTTICAVLIADFFFRMANAQDKRWYFRHNWIDLVASIPFYEVLRFGRLANVLRFARLLRFLRLRQAMRVLFYNFRGIDKLFDTFQLDLLRRAMIIAMALLFLGAFSITAFEDIEGQSSTQPGITEPSPEASFGESLWWSFTTVVTGGFADLYNPTSLVGRLVTVGLVLLGLTVTGIFTASLTSVLVEDESQRLERNQHELEAKVDILDQKLDLLSEETNEGLIALETVAQKLSNQSSRQGIATVLVETMLEDFEALQASVHLLEGDRLERIVHDGLDSVAPAGLIQVGEGFPGRVIATLLNYPDITEIDLEPETTLSLAVQGIEMACPLVAGGRVIGLLHAVLPDTLARIYLYNRVPMTLAHHAAMAFYAADLALAKE